MTRKSRTFGQLLRYIAAPQESGPALLQNLHSAPDDLEAIRHEFFVNSQLLPRRRNGVVLYHEILSFAAADRERVTPAIAEAVTRHYLEVRAPYALAYARTHYETACPHVHLVLSANAVASSQRLRLSQRQFAQIKQQLNRFVRQQFPQLKDSGRTRGVALLSPQHASGEEQRGERKEPRRQRVRRVVAGALLTATSWEEAQERLRPAAMQLYRRGRSCGVRDEAGRRYRLRTLGLAEVFAQVQRSWQAPQAIPAPRRGRSPEQGRGR